MTDAKGTPQLVKDVTLGRMSLGNIKNLIPPTPQSFIKMFLETELKPYFKILPKGNVKAVLLHEVLSEPLIAFRLASITKKLYNHFEKRGIGFGLETRNVAKLEELLMSSEIEVKYVMTAMNPLGYQMGIKKEAENAVMRLAERGVKVIAMNIMASGACTIEESVTYFKYFKEYLHTLAFGTSKPEHARSNAQILKSIG
jgi:hypothetical protein